MKDIFDKYNVTERVTFIDNLPYPYKAMQQSKCLLMCSRFEGTPIVALEAMLLGLPIVSTRADGMVELIDDKETGFLSDNDDELILRVIEVIENNLVYNTIRENIQNKLLKINNVEYYKNTLNEIYWKLF